MTDVTPTRTGTFRVWYAMNKRPTEDPGLLPPDYVIHNITGIGTVWRKGTGNSPYWDGDIYPDGPKWVNVPLAILATKSWNATPRWYIPTVPPASMDVSTGLLAFDAISYDTNYALVAESETIITPPTFDPSDPAWGYRANGGGAYWFESPESLEGWIENGGSLREHTYQGQKFHVAGDIARCRSLRGILENDARLVFPSSYDWVANPATITVTLKVCYSKPIVNLFPLNKFAEDNGVQVFPQVDETGDIDITLTGDLSGTYSFNPTTLYNSGPSETVVQTWTFSTVGPHTKDLGITASLALDTLPHVVREFIAAHGEGEYKAIPPAIYEVAQGGSAWTFSAANVDPSDYPPLSWVGGYLMQRWGGLMAHLVVTAESV
jgi:hypothetical protein